MIFRALILLSVAAPAAFAQPHGHDGDEDWAGMVGMTGALGPYLSTRESSGTSWQPDVTRHDGLHAMWGDWTIMAHGETDLVYSDQGGPRGDEKGFMAGMVMLSARRDLTEGQTLVLRSMLSFDPQMGKRGYPLLFAAGETADGVEHLVDYQHPHNLFMELAASYSVTIDNDASIFVYAGLPGEPALGPPAYMHRASAMDSPEAPISHHFLDSTHIANGVATLGLVWGHWKAEASTFSGREPDQFRTRINSPDLDSYSARLSWNPDPNWSLQVSAGRIHSPEQLEPDVDETRFTISATYNRPFGDNFWATTVAWGRKDLDPGRTLDAFLIESAVKFGDSDTIFGRLERIDAAELFDHSSPLHDTIAKPIKLSVGYVHDFQIAENLSLGIGGLLSAYAYSDRLEPEYGEPPLSSMMFARIKVQ
jgi:hypothetical protein